MKKAILVVLVALNISALLCAQEYTFETLTVEDGLSQSSVLCLAQDEKGFLWIGTRDGLNRYDGESFAVIRKIPFDTNALQSNVITSLLVSDHHGVYVGTNKGLQRYDQIKNQFTNIALNPDGTAVDIRSIYKDHFGVIWIASANGFFRVRVDTVTGQHKATPFYYQPLSEEKKRLSVRSFFHDHNNNFWVATVKGVLKTHYEDPGRPAFPVDISNAIISDIIIDGIDETGSGDIIAYNKASIYRYLPSKNGFMPISDQYSINTGESINYLEEGKLWILGDNGIRFVSLEDGSSEISPMISLPTIGLSQSRHRINFVLKDNIYDDFYWIATDLSGILKMYKRKKKFHTTFLQNIPNLEVTNPYLRHIVAKEDNVYINIGHGVVLYQRLNNQFDFITDLFPPETSTSSTSVSALSQSKSGDVFAINNFGITRIAPQEKTKTAIRKYLLPYEQRIDYNAFIETQNHFILGGRAGIISVLRKESLEEVANFTPNISSEPSGRSEITSILMDQQSNLWVGTLEGLLIYPNFIAGYDRIPKPISISYNFADTSGLVDNRVTCVYQDSKDIIWITTRNGLMTASIHDHKIVLNRINIAELKNQVLYGILESNHTYEFWLSSNNGLYRFNPTTGAVDNYNYQDGLQGNEFNSFSYFKAQSGELFFGGPKGFTSFFPEEILSDTASPPIWITNLTTTDNHQYNLLARDTSYPLELGFSQRSFSINFIGLNYKNTDDQSYYYNLRGAASLKGIALGKSQQVNFSQLDPGHYTIEVYSARKNGLTNGKSDSLQFYIKAPFWRMPWFFFLVTMFVAFLGWVLFYLRYRSKVQSLRAIDKVRKNISEDFHDELGSKLSIISMYSEFTKQQLGKDHTKAATYLDKVNDTASRLYENTRDLIWALNPQNDSLYDLFLQLKDFGEEMFQDTDIDFHSAGLADHWKNKNLPMRYKRHLLLIFKEGMHNALKHANCKTIKLSIDEKDDRLIFMLQDDGTGFDANAEHKGDGLKNMAQRAEQLHGGLHFISKKEGTRIWVELPFDILN